MDFRSNTQTHPMPITDATTEGSHGPARHIVMEPVSTRSEGMVYIGRLIPLGRQEDWSHSNSNTSSFGAPSQPNPVYNRTSILSRLTNGCCPCCTGSAQTQEREPARVGDSIFGILSILQRMEADDAMREASCRNCHQPFRGEQACGWTVGSWSRMYEVGECYSDDEWRRVIPFRHFREFALHISRSLTASNGHGTDSASVYALSQCWH
jgi:hypothetical protein